MQTLFDNPRVAYSLAPSDVLHIQYQHGGTLLSLTGSTAGQIKELGSNPWGRSSWATVYGKRDRGSLSHLATKCARTARATLALYLLTINNAP